MRIYENRNDKRDIQCGYCFNEGHNKRNCPVMKLQWQANIGSKAKTTRAMMGEGLIDVDKTMFPVRFQNHYNDNDARRQFLAHWDYMKDRFYPKPKVTKKRKKPKCGFCGSTAHNRRNCNKLKNFVYVLNETNKAYRAAYYDRFIDGMGLGNGALVKVRGFDPDVGIITNFPTEKIMFTNLVRHWSDYTTRATGSVMIDGNRTKISFSGDCFQTTMDDYNYDNYGIWLPLYSYWGRIKEVISPAPNRPTKEWFTGQSPCYEWIVKKRNQETLMNEFKSIIKEFYPHNDLRAKLGAKTYDQFYA